MLKSEKCFGCGKELDLVPTYLSERICGDCWRSLEKDDRVWDLSSFVSMLVSDGRTSFPEKLTPEEIEKSNWYEEKWNGWIGSEKEREKNQGKNFKPIFFRDYCQGKKRV